MIYITNDEILEKLIRPQELKCRMFNLRGKNTMVETTPSSFSKLRQRRFKGDSTKDSSSRTSSLLRNRLYTKEEFELLDTIYSDDGITQIKQETLNIEDFWPKEKDEYLSLPLKRTPLIGNLGWFLGGILASSAVWLIYTQVSINEIKTKADTEIIFQKSASIMTDKNFDKKAQSQLNKNNSKSFGFLSGLYTNTQTKTQKDQVSPEVKQEAPPPQIPVVRYHTVQNGDSLWIIANQYYSNPSPQNINKIMKANNMRRIGVLSIGQKLVIPE